MKSLYQSYLLQIKFPDITCHEQLTDICDSETYESVVGSISAPAIHQSNLAIRGLFYGVKRVR